ncbi:cardiolipin synthase [Roseibacterium sp. SDUM158017]|uniref:cardiolipin synthase n=1 Tax=Roseicyclus salinarum TaxID=3036773 RepID=UPI0024152F40|nr:cardiolipin synthase [Roseibacterium sp. SDUM158017]MDG4649529.1 cardiolipin synthase [Roseibacterium sp. SDUM158017]
MLNVILPILSAMLVALALWLAWRAAKTARTPQAAVGWVVFLLAAPYLAVVAYAFLGPHRYESRRRARRLSRKLFDDHRSDWPDAIGNDPLAINLRPFEQVAGLPVVRGNRAALLVDGQETFDALFEAIDAARHYLLVQFYIYRDDALGRKMADHLIEAARRGVSVRLGYDVFGSFGLGRGLLREMSQAGIEVMSTRRGGPIERRFQVNFRNHRKVVIADGRVGFLGGLNVGDEYMGRDPAYGAWRDTFCRIEGPMVTQLQLIFAEDWHWVTGEVLRDILDWSSEDGPGGMDGLIVATGPIDTEDTGSAMLFSTLAAARSRIWVSTPYLVPDLATLTALKHAAIEGKEVRILVPDAIDHYLPWLAAFAYFDELLEAGVEIWRYREGFLHQKAFLIDDGLAAVGTHNLDHRSSQLNFETMAYFFDKGFCAELEAVLRKDFARAVRLEKTLDEQPLRLRIAAPVARLMAPVL